MSQGRSIAVNVLTSLVGAAVWAVLSLIVGHYSTELQTWWAILGVYALYTVLSLLLALAGVLFLKYQGRLALYPSVSIRWRVLEKRIVYRIDEEGVLHFSRSIIAKAQVNNLDRFLDKFVWTGGESALPTPHGDVVRNVTVAQAGIWTIFESVINRSLRRGEEVLIDNRWPPLRNWASSSPFVSTSASEPTRKIIFEVKIPDRFRASNQAFIEELRSIDSILPFRTTVLEFNDSMLTWQVHPGPFRHYRIRWAWRGEDEILALTASTGDS